MWSCFRPQGHLVVTSRNSTRSGRNPGRGQRARRSSRRSPPLTTTTTTTTTTVAETRRLGRNPPFTSTTTTRLRRRPSLTILRGQVQVKAPTWRRQAVESACLNDHVGSDPSGVGCCVSVDRLFLQWSRMPRRTDQWDSMSAHIGTLRPRNVCTLLCTPNMPASTHREGKGQLSQILSPALSKNSVTSTISLQTHFLSSIDRYSPKQSHLYSTLCVCVGCHG